jgi:hypothetical protein
MIIYDDLQTLRQFYSTYTKRQVEELNEMVILGPFYETTKSVRETLSTGHAVIDVSKHTRDNSLVIVDASKVYRSDTDALSFMNIMAENSTKNGRRGFTFMGDMGAFQNRFNRNELISYELSLPKRYSPDRKGFCLYHRKDFDILSVDQKQKLIEHHGMVIELEGKDRPITG